MAKKSIDVFFMQPEKLIDLAETIQGGAWPSAVCAHGDSTLMRVACVVKVPDCTMFPGASKKSSSTLELIECRVERNLASDFECSGEIPVYTALKGHEGVSNSSISCTDPCSGRAGVNSAEPYNGSVRCERKSVWYSRRTIWRIGRRGCAHQVPLFCYKTLSDRLSNHKPPASAT